MFLGQDHDTSGITELFYCSAYGVYPMHAVIQHHPSMPGHHGRGAPANLQRLPRLDGRGQAMVGIEQAQTLRLKAVELHRTIRNPDTFVIEIDDSGAVIAIGFLWQGSRKKRTMNHRKLQFTSVVGDGDRKQVRILVVDMNEVDPTIWFKRSQPQPAPMEQVL